MAAKRKLVSRDVALAELRRRSDAYAQVLRERIMSQTFDMRMRAALEPLIVEFAKLRVAFAAHLDGEK